MSDNICDLKSLGHWGRYDYACYPHKTQCSLRWTLKMPSPPRVHRQIKIKAMLKLACIRAQLLPDMTHCICQTIKSTPALECIRLFKLSMMMLSPQLHCQAKCQKGSTTCKLDAHGLLFKTARMTPSKQDTALHRILSCQVTMASSQRIWTRLCPLLFDITALAAGQSEALNPPCIAVKRTRRDHLMGAALHGEASPAPALSWTRGPHTCPAPATRAGKVM